MSGLSDQRWQPTEFRRFDEAIPEQHVYCGSQQTPGRPT